MNRNNAGTLPVDSNLIARFDYQKDGIFDANFVFKMMDSRYGIGYYLHKQDQMAFIDFYHQKIKYFPCFMNGFLCKRVFSGIMFMYPINLRYTLVFEYFPSWIQKQMSSFYLIEFDYQANKFNFIRQESIKGHLRAFLLNSKNVGKFVSINKFKDQATDQTYHMFYLGQICNGKVIFDKNPMARLLKSDGLIHCVQLFDGKLVGIKREHAPHKRYDFSSVRMSYCVVDMEKKRFVKQFDFQLNDEFDLEYFHSQTRYVWTENQCLMIGNQKNVMHRTKRTHLYNFNILTHQCSIVYFNFADAFELSLNQNEILTVKSYGNKGIYNYTTRKPQKLGNIIWLGIRRQSMLMENDKLYDYAMEKLPLNSELQPFHVIY